MPVFFRFFEFPTENCQNFSEILSGWVVNVFECLQCISPQERMEVVDSVVWSQLVVSSEACLEKVIN